MIEPNKWRGETAIVIDGIPYLLRPRFSALMCIEQELGLSLMQLTQKLVDETMSLHELSVIINHSMDNRATLDFIKDALLRNGLKNAIEAVCALFTVIWAGFDGKTT